MTISKQKEIRIRKQKDIEKFNKELKYFFIYASIVGIIGLTILIVFVVK